MKMVHIHTRYFYRIGYGWRVKSTLKKKISESKEGTENESTMTLILYHRDISFPWLEELARELG